MQMPVVPQLNLNVDVVELIKTLRGLVEDIPKIPYALLNVPLEGKIEHMLLKERIAKLREIAVLRELGKSLLDIFLSKGSIVTGLKDASVRNDPATMKWVRELFAEVATNLLEIELILKDNYFSNTTLAIEGAQKVRSAILCYELMADISDEDMQKEEVMVALASITENLSDSGGKIIKKMDEYRFYLDHCGG